MPGQPFPDLFLVTSVELLLEAVTEVARTCRWQSLSLLMMIIEMVSVEKPQDVSRKRSYMFR